MGIIDELESKIKALENRGFVQGTNLQEDALLTLLKVNHTQILQNQPIYIDQSNIQFPDNGIMFVEFSGTGQIATVQRNNQTARQLNNGNAYTADVQLPLAMGGKKNDRLVFTNIEIDNILFVPLLKIGLSPAAPLSSAGGNAYPFDTTGSFNGKKVTVTTSALAISVDTILIDELTIVVPSTNTGTVTVGNASGQWIPLSAPSNGLAGISIRAIKPANVYIIGTNTTDVVIFWYGGA